MPSADPEALNIQQKHKYLNNNTANIPPLLERDVVRVARLLRSRTPTGRLLRTLLRRIRRPEAAYSDEDLQNLLILTLAETSNAPKPT